MSTEIKILTDDTHFVTPVFKQSAKAITGWGPNRCQAAYQQLSARRNVIVWGSNYDFRRRGRELAAIERRMKLVREQADRLGSSVTDANNIPADGGPMD